MKNAVSLERAKAKKPFTDGNLIKKCAFEMSKAFEDSKMAEKFQSVPLSHQTIQRRIVAMGERVEKSMLSLVKKSSYFSLCLDESTDQSDVSQILIFVRTTFDDFTSKEELFDICRLCGTTRGKEIYEAVKKAVDRIGGFDKCSAIATDGAPSMTGKKTGLVGLLRENGVTCPAIHCIIHQGALCGKSVKQNQVFQTVSKIINRGGNRSLLFSSQIQQVIDEFNTRFEEIESLKSSLLLYNNPFGALIEDQPPDLQIELCDLQADMFLISRQERGPELFKLLSKEKFPNLRDFGLKITSMFGGTYRCESAFSSMKYIKNHNRSNLTDSSLRHLVRLSTTEMEVDISSLVDEEPIDHSLHIRYNFLLLWPATTSKVLVLALGALQVGHP
ncbi:SCAN domain-containing protein 3-like [Diorhabda sublineata]|uniref:SCAN domain-containing protein 3-like n=1 Tax=Diorhabda sublineata TaxID=1163346 RepID=UPI0024E0A59C|nr:SCAN domain-containing protein 3-like [Diorhabda sublineata]